jgi:hypothetical protein
MLPPWVSRLGQPSQGIVRDQYLLGKHIQQIDPSAIDNGAGGAMGGFEEIGPK